MARIIAGQWLLQPFKRELAGHQIIDISGEPPVVRTHAATDTIASRAEEALRCVATHRLRNWPPILTQHKRGRISHMKRPPLEARMQQGK